MSPAAVLKLIPPEKRMFLVAVMLAEPAPVNVTFDNGVLKSIVAASIVKSKPLARLTAPATVTSANNGTADYEQGCGPRRNAGPTRDRIDVTGSQVDVCVSGSCTACQTKSYGDA